VPTSRRPLHVVQLPNLLVLISLWNASSWASLHPFALSPRTSSELRIGSERRPYSVLRHQSLDSHPLFLSFQIQIADAPEKAQSKGPPLKIVGRGMRPSGRELQCFYYSRSKSTYCWLQVAAIIQIPEAWTWDDRCVVQIIILIITVLVFWGAEIKTWLLGTCSSSTAFALIGGREDAPFYDHDGRHASCFVI